MNYPFRLLVGGAALVAVLWLANNPAPAGTPDLPKESYKKAADADLKFLQTRLNELAASDSPSLRSAKPAVAATILLATYADALGDAAFKAEVLKVGEAVNAKKYKEAAEMGKKLTLKPGTGKGGDLPKFAPFEGVAEKDKDGTYLATTMKLYGNTTKLDLPYGLNIEKDLHDLTSKDKPAKIDVEAVEILAARAAVINEYALHNPNETAREKPQNLKDWQKWSKQSVDLSKEIIAETTKKTPDLKVIRTKLGALEDTCLKCHDGFRYK